MSFSPNNFLLLPGESKDVTVNAVLPSPIDDGFHNLSFEVKTQYEFTISHYLLKVEKMLTLNGIGYNQQIMKKNTMMKIGLNWASMILNGLIH